MKIRALLIILLTAIFLVSCGKRKSLPDSEKILVKIGDEATISLNEFIRRAEYTPRPSYCRQNTYLNKKIILNSLIAEKLLALEAGDDNPIFSDEEFQLYIQGRKEQAMRQWMHHVEATDQVVLKPSEIQEGYQRAGREYEIEYFSITDRKILDQVMPDYTSDPRQFEDLFYKLTGDTVLPRKKVKYLDRERDRVHEALFSKEFSVGDVLEPVRLDNGSLFIRITGWSDEMALTENQQQERLTGVQEKMTEIQAGKIWTSRVSEIMRGKRMDFNEDVFHKLSALFFSVYFHDAEERRNQLIEKVWGVEEQDPDQIVENLSDDAFLKQPFFSVDGQVWTVEDFRRAIKLHPLVYRERKMPSNEFAGQFRLAVADLVRDHYVTEEAYKKGYDQIPEVQRNVNMWRDTYGAMYQKNVFLDSVKETRNFYKQSHAILEDRLNPYIRQLQEKYYKRIELDFDLFESVSLASIDLFVKQPEQPFMYVVPAFPVLTSLHMIDYIARME
jgi:phage major head subunit gpT-like protein